MKFARRGMAAFARRRETAGISTRKSALDAEIKKNRSEGIAKEPQA
jgi:hypothetical protein